MPRSIAPYLATLTVQLMGMLSACGGSDGSTPTLPASSSGTVTLSWTPPTENTDGSYLTDLAGYNIYYGVQEDVYTTKIHIDNPGISRYVVSGLSPNTYYFVATSFNTAGVESPFSTVVVKKVI